MNGERQRISEILELLEQAAIPAPSHRNRTMTDWADRMRRAKEMLADAQNAAIEMDILRGELVATQKSLANASVHNRALAAEIERLQGENRLILDALGMEKYRVLWRPVTDDGFKAQKAVLIVYKSLIMDVGIIMIARWTPMYEWGGLIDNFVTHWAPLPGLPEEVLE